MISYRGPWIDEEDYDFGFREGYETALAVVFGLLGMAQAIQDNPSVEACPFCLKYQYAYVIGTGWGKNDWLGAGERACMECFDREKVRSRAGSQGHPYR